MADYDPKTGSTIFGIDEDRIARWRAFRQSAGGYVHLDDGHQPVDASAPTAWSTSTISIW